MRQKSLPRVIYPEYYRGKSRGFTLIELMVAVAIIVLLAASGNLAYKAHQKRANLDVAVSELKDAIIQTQNYAFAPVNADDKHYVLVINMTDESQTYDSYAVGGWFDRIEAGYYGIYSAEKLDEDNRTI